MSRRAKYYECKGNEYGHATERTLAHAYTFGCYESKASAIERKTNMKLRKEGNSTQDKRKYCQTKGRSKKGEHKRIKVRSKKTEAKGHKLKSYLR